MTFIEQVRSQFFDHWHWTWLAITATSLAAAYLMMLVIRLISPKLRSLVNNTHSYRNGLLLDLLDGLNALVLFVWIFHVLSRSADGSTRAWRTITVITVSATIFQVGLWGIHLIRNWRDQVLVRKTQNDPSSASAIGLVSAMAQALFILIIVLIGLSNLGIDIGALIAGLGIGGIAVALAAQNVLGDLLASLSIILDKPFVIGDYIVAGNEKGTVEHIGIKTTRLRSLSGEQLVFSNKDLLESRLHNYKRMSERRIVQKFGVAFSTSASQLEQIPGWVKQFVEAEDKARFDRCHFAAFGASSLDYEFVFWIEDADFNFYMDRQQRILINIYKKFDAEGVEFAFPTRTVILERKTER
jgi:small-conductance mechanosensitive channel